MYPPLPRLTVSLPLPRSHTPVSPLLRLIFSLGVQTSSAWRPSDTIVIGDFPSHNAHKGGGVRPKPPEDRPELVGRSLCCRTFLFWYRYHVFVSVCLW